MTFPDYVRLPADVGLIQEQRCVAPLHNSLTRLSATTR